MIVFVIAAALALPAQVGGKGPGTPDASGSSNGAVVSRQATARFAACLVEGDSGAVSGILKSDFETAEYRDRLRRLAGASPECHARVGIAPDFRVPDLPLAGALAEKMIPGDGASLAQRLVKASTVDVPTSTMLDFIAICTTRFAPEAVANLLNTELDSPEEARAADALQRPVKHCSRGAHVTTTPASLRSILATAAFRLLAAQES